LVKNFAVYIKGTSSNLWGSNSPLRIHVNSICP